MRKVITIVKDQNSPYSLTPFGAVGEALPHPGNLQQYPCPLFQTACKMCCLAWALPVKNRNILLKCLFEEPSDWVANWKSLRQKSSEQKDQICVVNEYLSVLSNIVSLEYSNPKIVQFIYYCTNYFFWSYFASKVNE